MAGTYNVTHVRNSEKKQLWLGDIDLIFGMRVYNHKLQIDYEIHSGWMIFGQLTAVGLWNLDKYLDFNVNRNTTPSLYEKVVQHFKTNDLQQCVTNPTTIYGSTLDLVFTGGHLPSIIYNGCYYSDHMTLLIQKKIQWLLKCNVL